MVEGARVYRAYPTACADGRQRQHSCPHNRQMRISEWRLGCTPALAPLKHSRRALALGNSCVPCRKFGTPEIVV